MNDRYKAVYMLVTTSMYNMSGFIPATATLALPYPPVLLGLSLQTRSTLSVSSRSAPVDHGISLSMRMPRRSTSMPGNEDIVGRARPWTGMDRRIICAPDARRDMERMDGDRGV